MLFQTQPEVAQQQVKAILAEGQIVPLSVVVAVAVALALLEEMQQMKLVSSAGVV